MTPKDKAIELVKKFSELEMDVWDGEWQEYDEVPLTDEVAKQCALIAVDEILNLEVWHWPHNTPEGLLYWQQVRKEIEQLP